MHKYLICYDFCIYTFCRQPSWKLQKEFRYTEEKTQWNTWNQTKLKTNPLQTLKLKQSTNPPCSKPAIFLMCENKT